MEKKIIDLCIIIVDSIHSVITVTSNTMSEVLSLFIKLIMKEAS